MEGDHQLYHTHFRNITFIKNNPLHRLQLIQ